MEKCFMAIVYGKSIESGEKLNREMRKSIEHVDEFFADVRNGFKLLQYIHSDAGDQGHVIIEFFRNLSPEQLDEFKQNAKKVQVLNPVDTDMLADDFQLDLDCEATTCKNSLQRILSSESITTQLLTSCWIFDLEWGYVIDLDDEVLEVYTRIPGEISPYQRFFPLDKFSDHFDTAKNRKPLSRVCAFSISAPDISSYDYDKFDEAICRNIKAAKSRTDFEEVIEYDREQLEEGLYSSY